MDNFTIYTFCERLESTDKEWLVASVMVVMAGHQRWDRKKEYPIDANRTEIFDWLAYWQGEAIRYVTMELGEKR